MMRPDIARLIMTTLAIFAGCSESLEPEPATYSKLLTGENAKTWSLSKLYFVYEDDQFDPVDITDLIPPCERDDLYTYYREGKVLEIEEGPTTCRPDAEDLIARTSWDIVNSNASLLFGSNVSWTLFELTENSLVYGTKDTLQFQVFEDIPVFEEVVGYYQYSYTVDSEQ